jgi:uncharacterized membrane protein (TIGR02234 family)
MSDDGVGPPGSTQSGRQHTRGYGQTLLLGLASAAAATVGVSRPWQTATASVHDLPSITAQVDGADLAPLAGALGFVLLAAFGAVVATHGLVRRGLGVLVVICAVVVAIAVVHPGAAATAIEQGLSAKGWTGGSYHSSVSPWRWVVGAGAAGCGLAGALIARFGGEWATMSNRYDAPPTAKQMSAEELVDPTETDLWRSIDAGHDPTQTS